MRAAPALPWTFSYTLKARYLLAAAATALRSLRSQLSSPRTLHQLLLPSPSPTSRVLASSSSRRAHYASARPLPTKRCHCCSIGSMEVDAGSDLQVGGAALPPLAAAAVAEAAGDPGRTRDSRIHAPPFTSRDTHFGRVNRGGSCLRCAPLEHLST